MPSIDDRHLHPNYEYHTEDLVSDPLNADTGPRWNEQLRPQYHRHQSKIDDTVHDIRQRAELEQLRRDNAERESDKASRIPRPVDDIRRDRRDAPLGMR